MRLRLIEKITMWVEDGRIGDWLHPTHGPFPNFAARYKDEEGEYISAVWSIGTNDDPSWASMVEGPSSIRAVPLSYHWRVTRSDPPTVSTKIHKYQIVDMKIPKGNSVMHMIAKMSIVLFKKE